MATVNDNLESTLAEIGRASLGIKNPQVVTLDALQVVFRFSSTKRLEDGKQLPTNSADWANGAWWVLEEDYRKIIQRFNSGQLDLGTVARSAVAVQPSWSLMDVSVKAYLLNDMKVYMGQGSTQYRDVLPNGMEITLPGWPDIRQVYVPNMRKGARANIRVQRQKVIQSNSWGF